MDEKLQQHLDEIVQALNSGIDILGQQAPKLILETLSYYTWQSSLLAVVFLLLTGLSIFAFFWFKKKNDDSSYWEDWEIGMVFSAIATISLAIPFVIQVLNLIKIMVAPRLFLVEKIVNLI